MKSTTTTTDARKIASQENGKLGGVKTEEGKEISRRNAVKHGVLANALQNGYDKINFGGLYNRLGDEFNVTTLHQSIILEQLVMCYVKLARCSRFESEIMREALNSICLDDLLSSTVPTDYKDKATISEKTFKRLEVILIRYEPQLINRMLKLTETLKKYQTAKEV
jgi:hypothetical protein